jgi:hypothetical protein
MSMLAMLEPNKQVSDSQTGLALENSEDILRDLRERGRRNNQNGTYPRAAKPCADCNDIRVARREEPARERPHSR